MQGDGKRDETEGKNGLQASLGCEAGNERHETERCLCARVRACVVPSVFLDDCTVPRGLVYCGWSLLLNEDLA